jgi:AAA15 family ATPase/GTPase
LILGGQNVGKTSLLEAVWLGAGYLDDVSKLPSIFRHAEGGDVGRFFEMTFDKKIGMISLRISLKSISEYVKTEFNSPSIDKPVDGRRYRAYFGDIKFNQNRHYNSAPHDIFHDGSYRIQLPLCISLNPPSQDTAAELLDKSVIKRKIKELIKLLQQIEPRLEDIRALKPDGETRVYAELDGHPVYLPLPQLGHGFSRLLYLYSSLLVSDSKLVLIDEIENGIHYSSLPTMFKGIQQIATNNDIQSLITTHSWECLRAACEVFSDKPELFQVIRLERDGDNTKAVCIEGERMLRMMERDMEVR